MAAPARPEAVALAAAPPEVAAPSAAGRRAGPLGDAALQWLERRLEVDRCQVRKQLQRFEQRLERIAEGPLLVEARWAELRGQVDSIAETVHMLVGQSWQPPVERGASAQAGSGRAPRDGPDAPQEPPEASRPRPLQCRDAGPQSVDDRGTPLATGEDLLELREVLERQISGVREHVAELEATCVRQCLTKLEVRGTEPVPHPVFGEGALDAPLEATPVSQTPPAARLDSPLETPRTAARTCSARHRDLARGLDAQATRLLELSEVLSEVCGAHAEDTARAKAWAHEVERSVDCRLAAMERGVDCRLAAVSDALGPRAHGQDGLVEQLSKQVEELSERLLEWEHCLESLGRGSVAMRLRFEQLQAMVDRRICALADMLDTLPARTAAGRASPVRGGRGGCAK